MNADPGCLKAWFALLNSLLLKLIPPDTAKILPVCGSKAIIAPLISGNCLKLNKGNSPYSTESSFSNLSSTYIMSPTANTSFGFLIGGPKY